MSPDAMELTTRRGFLRVAGFTGGAGFAAACAPAATAPAAPAPASTGGGAPSGQKAAWEEEYDKLVAAAKKEGKLVGLSLVGDGYRKTLDAFEAAFPGIATELQTFASASIWGPKVTEERKAGIYSFDVAIIAPGSALRTYRDAGFWDPYRTLLIRPDIREDKNWTNGFDGNWIDTKRELAFAVDSSVTHAVAINTKLVQENEIKSALDLLNPKWKGKMIAADARAGDIRLPITAMRLSHGDDAARRLLTEMDSTVSREPRTIAEGLVRGRYPIAIGVRVEILKEFVSQGVAGDVKLLDLPDIDYVPRNCMFLFNRAPHASAAKLFLNWIFTKDGQDRFTKATAFNSPRTDVPPTDPSRYAKSLKDYRVVNREDEFDALLKTDELLKQWGLVG